MLGSRKLMKQKFKLFTRNINIEDLPGVLGNKGTWPFTFREYIREQKDILGNRENQNRRNTFREHGNTRKILLGTMEHGLPPPGRPSVLLFKP